MRQRLAQEAARIIVESGTHDFLLAKRKAAQHLGAHDTRQLPSNQEIEQALVEYQRLFRSQTQPQRLQQLRETALEAMHFFTAYEPRLVGPVLTGTADVNTPVSLHVFTDTAEDISFTLLEHHIPFDIADKTLRIGMDEHASFPGYRFIANEIVVEVIVFPVSKRLPTPLSPVDGRPMPRANQTTLEQLLDAALQNP
jgi:hypothetical protein